MTNQPINRPDRPRRGAPQQPRPTASPLQHPAGGSSSRRDASDFFAAQQASSANQELLIRKRKRRNTKRKKYIRVIAVVVLSLVLVGGGVAFGIISSIKAGEEAIRNAAQAESVLSNEKAITYDEGKTVKYNGHTYTLNKNIVSICIIGFDRTTPAETGETAGQSDAVMVLAMDTTTGKATAIAIPRDSMVEVGEFVGDAFIGLDKMQLCLAYSYGDGRETSCQYTTAAASRVLYNMPLSYYFAIDLSGVGPINDSIGGVSLTPLQSIPDTGIVENEPTTLFDKNALSYVQWRDETQLTSSLERQARQTQYVKAFAAQALAAAKGNVGTLLDLYNTASQYSITNLGTSEFSYLASSVLSKGITDLNVVTLSGTMEQGEKYAEYNLDRTSVYEAVLNAYYSKVD